MTTYDKCPNCFMPIGASTVCLNCGNDYSKDKKYTGVLPPFTLLDNRYLIGKVLGKGGFGITYIAKDTYSNTICAIKEYMPSEYSTRSGSTQSIVPYSDEKAKFVFTHGREKFIEEARTLKKLLNDPIVVDILGYFEQNNTAYLVMEYLDGQDLRKQARSSGGKLDPDFAKMVFLTVASSLMEIHKKEILHRDLSPENIIVTKNGNIKLIDFGAARNFVSTQNKGMSILLKPGFAPPEQYNAKGCQGPWSDVYALCATFYTLVSGKPLVDALFRYRGEEQPSLASLGCNVTKKTSDVIERGMELDFKRRYKDFKELLDDIDIASAAPKPVPQQMPPRSVSQQQIPPRPTSPQPVPQPAPQPVSRPMQRTIPHHNTVESTMHTPPVPVQYPTASRPAVQPRPTQPYIAALVGNTLCNKVMLGQNDIFKVGRSAQSCQYVISGDTNISRIHCYVRFDGNRIYLCDTSSNGTFFENGNQLVKNREYQVSPGTKFYLATRNHMLIINI